MKAEKTQELEKLLEKLKGESIKVSWSKGFVSKVGKHELIEIVIESLNALFIQALKGRFEGLEEWLSPQRCEGTVQLSERVETRTTCIGSVLDLHVHFVYETVESDEGLAVTATMRAIRVPEASKQQ
jgi:hypothetical protein